MSLLETFKLIKKNVIKKKRKKRKSNDILGSIKREKYERRERKLKLKEKIL